MEIKLNETTKSINFDYEIVDYPGDDPHGETEFNEAAGDILKSILDDAMAKQDYVQVELIFFIKSNQLIHKIIHDRQGATRA